jgi:uncharacterized protein YegP (UPF0339 family)
MKEKTYFEIYKDKKGEFRWRLVSKNKEIVATGGEGYTSKASVKSAVKKLKVWALTETINEVEK